MARAAPAQKKLAGWNEMEPVQRINAGQAPYTDRQMDNFNADAAGFLLGLGSFAPGIGDAAGLAADAEMYYNNPEERTLSNFGLTALGALPFMPSRAASKQLFHGSNMGLEKIDQSGLFGGVFASAQKKVAGSHGEQIYEFDIPDPEIANTFILNHEIPYEKLKNAINKVNPGLGDDDFDNWYKAVIEDKSHRLDEDDLLRIFGMDDYGEASWEAQRQRGALARELGYGAVEMSDEHGTTYLIVKDYPKNRIE